VSNYVEWTESQVKWGQRLLLNWEPSQLFALSDSVPGKPILVIATCWATNESPFTVTNRCCEARGRSMQWRASDGTTDFRIGTFATFYFVPKTRQFWKKNFHQKFRDKNTILQPYRKNDDCGRAAIEWAEKCSLPVFHQKTLSSKNAQNLQHLYRPIQN